MEIYWTVNITYIPQELFVISDNSCFLMFYRYLILKHINIFAGLQCLDLHMVLLYMIINYGYLQATMVMLD